MPANPQPVGHTRAHRAQYGRAPAQLGPVPGLAAGRLRVAHGNEYACRIRGVRATISKPVCSSGAMSIGLPSTPSSLPARPASRRALPRRCRRIRRRLRQHRRALRPSPGASGRLRDRRHGPAAPRSPRRNVRQRPVHPPPDLDCRLESACETCAYLRTGPWLLPILAASATRPDTTARTTGPPSSTPPVQPAIRTRSEGLGGPAFRQAGPRCSRSRHVCRPGGDG